MKMWNRTGRLCLSLSLILLALIAPACAAEPDTIRLDADKISFEESTGVATAEGNVRINNSEIRLFAPYVEYDSEAQQIRALSSSEGSVTFLSAGNRLSGEQLDYNVLSRSGTLRHPNGKVEAFYVRGDMLEVAPAPPAAKSRKSASSKEASEYEDMSARWTSASLSTCNHTEPHYRLEAKEVSVIPGRRLVIKRPKVYLGETLLFSYPFDYHFPLGDRSRRGKTTFFPKIGYESSKGAGLGVTGALGWETGYVGLEALVWTDGIWEGEAYLSQEVAKDLSVYGAVRREYDKDRDTTAWRPKWGLEYERNGWQLEAGWSQRELVTIEKRAGRDSRYIVWKQPEVNIVSPWYEDRAAGGYFRFFGNWGRYEDATEGRGRTIERMGAGAQVYGEFGSNREDFRPFYNALYWYYKYDDDFRDKQQILDAALGVRWRFGDLSMETAYLRRWAWGNSPMAWDDYEPREEVYQEISYRLPSKSNEQFWRVGVRAAYSIDESELAEMVYKVAYDQHCLLWEGVYRDDRIGDDDWFGLKLTIKAYPESGVRMSGSDLFEPSKAPNELAPRFNADEF